MRPGDDLLLEIVLSDGTTRWVRAFTTVTPGLVVHRAVVGDRWTATHQRSSLMLAQFDDPEAAQAFAASVCQFDFTKPGADLTADPEFRPVVRAAREALGYSIDAGSSPALVAELVCR